jgi:hypothetical protein
LSLLQSYHLTSRLWVVTWIGLGGRATALCWRMGDFCDWYLWRGAGDFRFFVHFWCSDCYLITVINILLTPLLGWRHHWQIWRVRHHHGW